MDEPALRICNLHYTYPDGVEALCGVNLCVARGETVGLLGPNGAGKSTLLLHLNGLLGNGEAVVVEGMAVVGANIPTVRQRVGLVFQDPDDQLFMPTVADDVSFGPRNCGYEEAAVAERMRAALAQVGMEGHETRPPHHLSAGQKKRVALATVLVMDCSLLALDEPTAGLDPRGRRDIIALLHRLPQTQIIATHDMALAWELCRRVFLMDEGRIVAEGPTQQVLQDDALLDRHGLERPMVAR